MKYICSNCGKCCDTFYKKGIVLSDLLWLIIIFSSLGLALILYIIYRFNNREKNCCPFCKAENVLVPIDSPRGKQLSESFDSNMINEFVFNDSSETTYENLKNKLKRFAIFLFAAIIFLILITYVQISINKDLFY